MTDNDDTTDDTTEESLADQFTAAQTGPFRYTVQSTRNDDTTVHRVDLQEVNCSCEDMTYNHSGSSRVTPTSDGGASVCDHLRFVIDIHPQLEVPESGVYQAMGLMQEANTIKQTIKDQSDQLEEAIVQLRDAQAGIEASNAAGGDESDTAGSGTDDSAPGGMTEADVEKAAEDLQAAFDDVIDDMQVEHNDGIVWFQTGRDTPDDWPFPGGDETFSVITSPDCVMFVHDGSADWADSPHKHFDSKPGEWWKNALDPQDVDEYISEVLE